MHPLYLHSFWKFYTSRTCADLAFQLKSQQHGWAKSPGWLSPQLELPAWGPNSLANIRVEPARPLCFRTRYTNHHPNFSGKSSYFSHELRTGKLKYCIPAAAFRKRAKASGVHGKAPLKLLHFDRCLFLGKVVLVPCGQEHFYFTSIFVLWIEAACISGQQRVIQHRHLLVCHHTSVSALCMLETHAQEGFMCQQNSRYNPTASCSVHFFLTKILRISQEFN